jgi:hypothetical protein
VMSKGVDSQSYRPCREECSYTRPIILGRSTEMYDLAAARSNILAGQEQHSA